MSQDLFLVGPNQAFKQVQEAIDTLINQQGNEPFTSEKKILIAEEGSYQQFRIPTDSLRPEETNRLVIGSANGILAKVDRGLTVSDTTFSNGCYIGSNVPNVTIQKMYFTGFTKGVVFGVNSHNPILQKCIILDSENIGAWAYQCDRAQFINNIIINCKYGIATELVNNVAIINNTIYNESAYTDSNSTCIYINLQRDRGKGELDHGVASVFNNIAYSVSGNCLLINQRDIGNIQSDFNDLYTQSGNVVRVRVEIPEDDTDFSDATYNDLSTLQDWRNESQWDSFSISDHPGFIQQNPEFGGSSINLGLLPLSPCISSAKLLCGDPTNDLPSYIDDSLLCTDILDRTRGAQPTIGANEVSVQEGFFGHSIFTTSTVEEQPQLTCGSQWGALDLATSQYANEVSCWFPELKSGFFFVRDKPYYLYANKRAETLASCTRTTFVLPHPISKQGLAINVSGKDVTDTATWRIEGNIVQLDHNGLDIDSLNDEVVISGLFKEWISDNEQFLYREVNHIFRIKDGEQSFWLPSNPKDAAPIVITDDTIAPLDNTGLLPMEFKTHWDTQNEQTQIIPSPHTNLLLNPQFEYGVELVDELSELSISTGDFSVLSNPIRRQQDDATRRHILSKPLSVKANDKKSFKVTNSFLARGIASGISMTHHGYEFPEDYEVVTDGRIACRTVVQAEGKRSVRPLMGRQFLTFDIPTGDTGEHYIAQDVPVDVNQNYLFTTYVAAPNSTGDMTATVESIDYDGRILSTHGPYSYSVVSPEVELTGESHPWTRVGLSIGNQPDSRRNVNPITIDMAYTGLIPINSGAERIIVKISSDTGNPLSIDCMQLETGVSPTPYNRIPRGSDVTVEYEDSNSGFYRITDLAVSPIRNPKVDGFLQITPVPAGQFDTGAPTNVTTLTDWFWPEGRLNHLPWAKTSGINKWSRTTWFHDEYQGVTHNEMSWTEGLPHPETISTTPGIPSSLQDSSGDLFNVLVKDTNGNPCAFNECSMEIYDAKSEFPGWLARREFGLPTQLGQKITTNLNTKGSASVLFYPPSSEDIEYRGDKPTMIDVDMSTGLPEGNRIYGFIETNYVVFPEGHGNITVHDQYMTKISVDDTAQLTGTLSPFTDSKGYSHYNMRSFAQNCDIRVFNDMTGEFDRELQRSVDPTIGFGQFFYDELTSRITIKGTASSNIQVRYKPRLAWIQPEYPRRIYIDKEVLDQVTGDIIVNYNAEVRMKATALAPQNTVGLPSKFREVSLVAQNKYVGQD